MNVTDEILNISTDEEFRRAALRLFRCQAAACEPYREYLSLAGFTPEYVRTVDRIEQIPFMPVEVFKLRDVYCGDTNPEAVFTSSATTGMTPSRHPVQSLEHYERVFTAAFRHFYGDPAHYGIYALLPSYLERQGSSLVYMADRLIAAGVSGGFYLHDHERLLNDMAADPRPKILLGVSYALLDLAESGGARLHNTIVMETGGMKGRRREIPRAEFHRILCEAFGVGTIHSEYGMAELMSQAYSSGGGLFRTPSWMRVAVRDVNDPFALLPAGSRGGINIIDLANVHSCAFIQTRDAGRVFDDGSFVVEGRLARSEMRGCNLLVQ